MSIHDELQATITAMVQRGKGILAADESLPTITKRFRAVGIECDAETRRLYRQLLLSTPGIGDYIAAAILFEETLEQQSGDGIPLPELARRQGIVPGIKVDKGLVPLANAPGDQVTQGLDGLAERLAGYRERGARFAKWRVVYPIGAANPTPLGIQTNAEVLARYAAACQEAGLVPIVEPEVLIDGDHGIEQAETITEAVQHEVFHALYRHRVRLEYTILKPSMVVPGKAHPAKARPEEVAERTVRVLRRTVPAAVPSINFLSGGQTPQEATANLNAMNAAYPGQPWLLSFSMPAPFRNRPWPFGTASPTRSPPPRPPSCTGRGSTAWPSGGNTTRAWSKPDAHPARSTRPIGPVLERAGPERAERFHLQRNNPRRRAGLPWCRPGSRRHEADTPDPNVGGPLAR